MTREERMNSALLPILEKMREHGATDEMCKMYDNGFHVGAMWADANPRWISVEDELPKEESWVLAVVDDKVATWYYEGGNLREIKDVYNITHWMPLPQPPMKGGAL